MNDYPPKTLELFLVDGTINGVIEVELSNWNGKAIKIPRKKFSEYGKEVLDGEGIYFLICENENNGEEEVYIGESSNVYDRNYNRLHNSNSNDFYDWKTMIVFMRKNLDSGKRLYAEHKIRNIAEDCNRYNVLTSQTRDEQLKKAYKYEMDEFIEHVRTILNILGYKILEPFIENKEKQLVWSLTVNKDKKEDIKAQGIYNEYTGEMIVLKGSIISETSSEVLNNRVRLLRENTFNNGKIDKDSKLTEDVLCNSPSEAFKFVLGYPGGPVAWKNEKGYSLKEYINDLSNDENIDL